MTKISQKQNLSLDLIRILATLGVIAIHTDVITSSTTNYLGGLSWWFANTIHSLASVSVPLFVMLTGALILPKRQLSWNYVFKKVSVKFLIPLIVWVFFYQYWLVGNYESFLTSFISKLLFTDVGHLYYLLITICLYLLVPMIQKIIARLSLKKQIYLIIICTIVSVIYLLARYTVLKSVDTINISTIAIPFLSYFLLGNLLVHKILSNKSLIVSIVALLILTIFTSVATYQNILHFNEGNLFFWTFGGGNYFFEPFTIHVFGMTIVSFLILNTIGKKLSTILNWKIIKYVSQLTFGIYLIHPFILTQIDHYFHLSIHLVSYPLWLYYLQKIFLLTLLSGACVAVIKKIPVVNLSVGGQ